MFIVIQHATVLIAHDVFDNVIVLNFTCNLLFFSLLCEAAELQIHMRRSKCAAIPSCYADSQLGHLILGLEIYQSLDWREN